MYMRLGVSVSRPQASVKNKARTTIKNDLNNPQYANFFRTVRFSRGVHRKTEGETETGSPGV